MMRIGVDIDGVLFPWDTVARRVLHARYGDVSQEPSRTWSALKGEVSKSAWHWLWSTEGQQRVFGQIEHSYGDAVDAVRALLDTGHQVHFVTHRDPATTIHHTAAFLREHFWGRRWAGVHSIRSTTHKTDLGRWDVFVDDKPSTVLGFVERESTRVFAPRRPWNESELEDVPGLSLYDDPMDVVRWVEGVSGGCDHVWAPSQDGAVCRRCRADDR